MLKDYKFYAKIRFYNSLLYLTGIYSNLLNPLNKKEMVFLLFLLRFHILFFAKKQMPRLETMRAKNMLDFLRI